MFFRFKIKIAIAAMALCQTTIATSHAGQESFTPCDFNMLKPEEQTRAVLKRFDGLATEAKSKSLNVTPYSLIASRALLLTTLEQIQVSRERIIDIGHRIFSSTASEEDRAAVMLYFANEKTQAPAKELGQVRATLRFMSRLNQRIQLYSMNHLVYPNEAVSAVQNALEKNFVLQTDLEQFLNGATLIRISRRASPFIINSMNQYVQSLTLKSLLQSFDGDVPQMKIMLETFLGFLFFPSAIGQANALIMITELQRVFQEGILSKDSMMRAFAQETIEDLEMLKTKALALP